MDAQLTGLLIAARRKEKGLSQTELAEQLHVTDKAISRWETGRGMPSVDNLEPLGEVLGLSVSELLSGRVLTPEELPKEAGEQIVKQMKEKRKGLWQGILAVLLLLLLAVGLYVSYFYFTSVRVEDNGALARAAEEYLGQWGDDPGHIQVVQTEQRGDYLAALCINDYGDWCMCVYERSDIFENRWRANGGKTRLKAGQLGSWNFGNAEQAVIIFCGGNLPERAAYYTFENSDIKYTCPIRNGQVLDIFLLPDTDDISSYPKQLQDAEFQPLA